MRKRHFTSILLALAVCLAGSAHGAQLEWARRVESGIVDASAVIVDVDGDGGREIVMCSTAGWVLLWNSEGQEVWSYELGGEITVPAAVADLDGRPGMEICALNKAGKLACVSAKGRALWEYNLPVGVQWGAATVAVRDVDSDRSAEVITADSAGHLVCLDKRGSVEWQYDCPSGINSPLAIANLDGEGQDEILLGGDDGNVRCLSGGGSPLWSFQADSAVRSGPVAADIDGQPGLEVLVGSRDGAFYALSPAGTLLWRFDSGAEIDTCICVADVDGDGREDILLGNLEGKLFRLASDGTERWRYDVKMRSRRPPAVADLDGDGKVEILLGNYSGYLYVLTPAGELRERILLGGSMNATPAVADLNDDGRFEAVCPITTGEVRCYSWHSTASSPNPKVLWPMYRYDAAQTASPAHASPAAHTVTASADYGAVLVGANEFRVEVANPDREPLRIELVMAVRGAQAPSRLIAESSDEQVNPSLTYEVDGRAARDITFSYAVSREPTGEVLCQGERSFYAAPFANDIALMGELVAGLGETTGLEPSAAAYFARQRDAFAHRLREFEKKVVGASLHDEDEFAELKRAVIGARSELARLGSLLKTARSHYGNGGSKIAVWSANPWAPFAGIGDLPGEVPAVPRFELDVYRGEYESAAFNVANLSPETATVRVHMEPLAAEPATENEQTDLNPYDFFTLHEVASIPTVAGTYSADALPRLNQGRLLTLSPWSARQLWLILSTGDLAPGTYATAVTLSSVELEPVTVRCDMSARVRSVALPEPSPLNFCNWGYVYGSVIRDYEEQARDDLVSHGTNVFVITTHHTPAAQFDSDGSLVGSIDYTKHDFIVNLYKDHGFLMFFNYQTVLKGRDGDPYMSPAWKKAYAAWLAEWVAHLNELGVGYDGFALYPVDEPGLHDTGRDLVEKFIEIGALTREADPNILIYTDPVGGARLDHLKEMTPYVDIWCPNRGAIVLAQNDPRLDYLLSTGKPVWTYECEGNAKEQPPLVYYRGQPWLAWHHGLTGIGFWSYCTSRFDPWFRPVGERANDYLLIYQGDGVVTSKRWEACRDGVEDYGALWRLRRSVELGIVEGVDATILQRATSLSETAAADIAAWSDRVHLLQYADHPRDAAARDWRVLKEYRKQIADITEQIQQAIEDLGR